MDKLLISESKNGVELKIYRREYGDEFTDYAVYRFAQDKRISPDNAGLDDNVFQSIFELGKFYFLRSEKLYSGFVFMNTLKMETPPFPRHSEDGEVFLENGARLVHYLNSLSDSGKLFLREEGFTCENEEVAAYLNRQLEAGNLLAHPRNNEKTVFCAIHPSLGMLSSEKKGDNIILNSHFFILELSDMKSPHSFIGQPFGGFVSGGKIILPPLFKRPMLLVDKEGNSHIEAISIEDMKIIIEKSEYSHGKNAIFYRRPDTAVTPEREGTDLVIVNDRIVGYKFGGNTHVPDAGFVLHLDKRYVPNELDVEFEMDKDVEFGLQAGPALVVDGVKINKVLGEYYHDLASQSESEVNSFPPNVFDSNWTTAKASRTAIGISDKEMVLLWASGCNTGEYVEGYESLGLTFEEIASIMTNEGVENAISLDGGGSSQILCQGGKALKLADRRGIKGLEFERPTPLGIKISLRKGL